jgi:hypothetical protein
LVPILKARCLLPNHWAVMCMTTVDDSPESGQQGQRQAGDSTEIEITPEMVARAADELMASLAEYLPPAWALASIVADRILAAGLGIARDQTGVAAATLTEVQPILPAPRSPL